MEKVVSPFDYDAKIILDLCKFVLLQLQFYFPDQECFIFQKKLRLGVYIYMCILFFFYNKNVLHVLASEEQPYIFTVF